MDVTAIQPMLLSIRRISCPTQNKLYGGPQVTTFIQTSSHHTHHNDTTSTPQLHHNYNYTPTSHFLKEVWCGCGVV